MHKKRGKENRPKPSNLVNYKDLERNVLEEISKEFIQDKKEKKGK
ncbi:MAG: hypothetical protein ACOX43_01915 [Bacilli bacterium]|jgi:hypothetical protein